MTFAYIAGIIQAGAALHRRKVARMYGQPRLRPDGNECDI